MESALDRSRLFQPGDLGGGLGHRDVAASQRHPRVALSAAFDRLVVGCRYLGSTEHIVGSRSSEVVRLDRYIGIGTDIGLAQATASRSDTRLSRAARWGRGLGPSNRLVERDRLGKRGNAGHKHGTGEERRAYRE